MNSIGIYNETDSLKEEVKDLPKLLEFALEDQKITNVDFNIIINRRRRPESQHSALKKTCSSEQVF